MNTLNIETGGYLLLASSLLSAGFGVKAQQPTPADFPGIIGRTLDDSKEVWPQNPKAPEGAPNVIWVIYLKNSESAHIFNTIVPDGTAVFEEISGSISKRISFMNCESERINKMIKYSGGALPIKTE